MQTFLVRPSQLDSRRLNKQSVECYQIAKVLLQKLGKLPIRTKLDKYGKVVQVKAWHNHPAVRMWEGYEQYFVEVYWLQIISECYAREISTVNLQARREEINVLISQLPFTKSRPLPAFTHNKKVIFTHKHNLYKKAPELYPQFAYTQEFSKSRIPYIWWIDNKPDNQVLYEEVSLFLHNREKNVRPS